MRGRNTKLLDLGGLCNQLLVFSRFCCTSLRSGYRISGRTIFESSLKEARYVKHVVSRISVFFIFFNGGPRYSNDVVARVFHCGSVIWLPTKPRRDFYVISMVCKRANF